MSEIHNIQPIFDKNSKILILGSFPSAKSREGKFFYHHPQNRFWKVISNVLSLPCPETIEQKRYMLLNNNIALWDVIHSCDIYGSSDSSIRNVTANDINFILKQANIRMIFANGNKSYSLYKKLCYKKTGYEVIPLPSTSPANAAFSLNDLCMKWNVIKDYLF